MARRRGRAGTAAARAALVALAAALALLAAPRRGEAWGFTAHRMVQRKAIGALPPPLRALFDANASYVVEHAIDPDLWRAAGNVEEGYGHYLDMDSFGSYPFPDIPRVESEHLARHGADAAAKGRLPWRVADVYRELVAAFRARDGARILERASILGHYVSDAHVPLHAVTNYDGKLTGQAGIHDRWETHLVERFERQIDAAVVPAPARRVGDPVGLAFDALLASAKAVPDLLAADRACAGSLDRLDTPQDERYDDRYYSRFYEREGATLVARASAAATAVASLWLSAWEDAGRPPLPAYRVPYVRRQSKAILISLDGAPAPLIDDAVRRGLMPRLARLRAQGAVARGVVTSLPAKTASAHATLFSGAWPAAHGIPGNEIPVSGASVLDWANGADSAALLAEPIWVTAARQGLDVTVATGLQAFPGGPFGEQRRFGGNFDRSLTLIDGYRGRKADDAVYDAADLPLRPAASWTGLPPHEGEARESSLAVAGGRVEVLAFDDPADPVHGLDTLLVAPRKDGTAGVALKPRPPLGADASGFAGIRLKLDGEDVGIQFRLFTLAPDGSEILLYRSRVHVLAASRPRVAAAAFEATGGFVGNGAYELYDRGALGAPLWRGGDGSAERRYLETVALAVRQITQLADFAMDRTAWDLFLTYLPIPDEVLHQWLGYLDVSLPGHDPGLAARLRPFLDDALGLVDGFVGHVAERAGDHTVLAIASDHGLVGANRAVRPNVALARAGLLEVDAVGQVDLAHTRAVYFPGNTGFVLLNRVGRKGGIVGPDAEEQVRRDAATALLALRDPATGAPVISAVLDARTGAGRGLGLLADGDLFVTFAHGYTPLADLEGEPVQAEAPKGVHFQDAERPEMWAALTFAGPGVAAGADLGLLRLVDVAPTLCALIGLDPPAQAAGSVAEPALARKAAVPAGHP